MVQGNEILRALGNLEGTVKSMQGTISSMSEQWARQEKDASDGRRALYGRFESLSEQMGKISSDCRAVMEDVAGIKHDIEEDIMPTVSAYKAGVSHKAGAMWASGLYWTFLCALAAAAGYLIHFYYFAPH